ncbi:MAG: tripartite tricarboxylate transporter TctB family protein, partial [Paracoccaceae bacterium]
VTMLAIFAGMLAVAFTYPANARFMPYVIGIPAIGLCLMQLVADLRRAGKAQSVTDSSDADGEPVGLATELTTWAYFVLFVGGVLLFGFLICVPFLVTIYLWREAQVRPSYALLAGLGFTLTLHLMFERVLTFRLHEGLVTQFLLDRLA